MSTVPPSPPRTRRESFADGLTVRIDERGSGRPILVLHGGGGPQTVAGISSALASRACVLTPTLPGFAGEPRPEWFDSIDDLALTYLDLLERLDLHDVMVVGSSIGGWIAAEMAVRDTSRLSSIVLVDAVGIQVEGHPIADVFPLTPDELFALSFHNPAAFRIDPVTLSPEQLAATAANFQALKVYDQGQGMRDPKLRRRLARVRIPALVVWGESDGVVDPATLSPEQLAATAANFQTLKVYDQGQGMCDPKLRRRLARVRIPALVVWGESDGVVDPDYGRAYAQSLPNARFALIPEAGHLPQIEQPERLLKLVWGFADSITAPPPVAGSFEKR